MCGIAGIADFRLHLGAGLEHVVAAMCGALIHRGPDDAGTWADGEAGISLGHRRLSILDLSPLGRQPMESADGNFVIAFNGEIYNFRDLRAELLALGHRFRGHSDTEVMLAGFCAWGVRGAIDRMTGMFAFAVWDKHRHRLTLARDRLGEKPLYYGWVGDVFAFASELAAFLPLPGWEGEVDRDALALFLRYNYFPAPHSVIRGIRQLQPGCLLELDFQSGARPVVREEKYWSYLDVARRGIENPFRGGEQEAVAQLDMLLRKTVRRQMAADVPLGAFLSGGIDSTLIVSLMQAQSAKPVHTFTIGFEDAAYDESGYAETVARHIGTNHTQLMVRPQDVLDVIPNLPSIFSEPFADSSQVPTYLVSKLTRRHVTVGLSGDGGDELFGGYVRYHWETILRAAFRRLPARLRLRSAQALLSANPEHLSRYLDRAQKILPSSMRQSLWGDKLIKFAQVMALQGPDQIYRSLVSTWKNPEDIVLGASEPSPIAAGVEAALSAFHPVDRMMYLDSVTYLPHDIMVKVDRASMAVSLETRAPFLDHDLVAFAWTLPRHYKVRGRAGKWILREVLDRYVPRELMDRPKKGFGMPLGKWLRGPLRDWAESLLDERRLRQDGYFRADRIRRDWEEHLRGGRNWSFKLWNILMFQGWLDARKQIPSPEHQMVAARPR